MIRWLKKRKTPSVPDTPAVPVYDREKSFSPQRLAAISRIEQDMDSRICIGQWDRGQRVPSAEALRNAYYTDFTRTDVNYALRRLVDKGLLTLDDNGKYRRIA